MFTWLCWSKRHEEGSHEVGKCLGEDDSLSEVKALHFNARACNACVEINLVRVHDRIPPAIAFMDMPASLPFALKDSQCVVRDL